MQIVQRILSKIVGEQIPADEQELVSGGIIYCDEGTILTRVNARWQCDDETGEPPYDC